MIILSCTTFCSLLTVAHNYQHFSLLSRFPIPDKFPDPDGMDARLFLDQCFQNEVEKYCYMWKETGEYAKKNLELKL